MASTYRNPLKLSYLLCATCEVVIALLLLLQISFAFLVFQLMKHFCVSYNVNMDGISSMKVCGYNQHPCVDDMEVVEEEETTLISSTSKPFPAACGCTTAPPCREIHKMTQYVVKKTKKSNGRAKDSDKEKDEFDQNTEDSDDITEECDQRSPEFGWENRGLDECKDSDETDDCSIKEGTCCTDHTDVVMKLEKAIQAQHIQLRRVYTELEEERGAAESAANEAMAMILRLQEEKSALQLEAAHFRRIAEEKAIHDEEAIRILENDLGRKETECLLLEEEVHALRARSVDKADNPRQQDHYAFASCLSSPCPGWHDVCYSKGVESIESGDSQKSCAPSIIVESKVDQINVREKNVDRFGVESNVEGIESRILDASYLDHLRIRSGTVASHVASSKKPQLSTNKEEEENADDFNDVISSILLKLCALENQQALEASELWDVTLSKGPCRSASESYGMEERERHPRHTSNFIAFNMEEEEEQQEEKVVNIDVAYMNCKSLPEAYMPEDIIEVYEAKKAKDHKFQDTESCEEELKHLDIPSLMPSISPELSVSASERIKSEEACEDHKDNWKFKSVITLEDIDSRLQALETQTPLLRNQSISSMNNTYIDLFKEIRGLLHTIQTVPNLKGGKLRKCLFSDDPEMD